MKTEITLSIAQYENLMTLRDSEEPLLPLMLYVKKKFVVKLSSRLDTNISFQHDKSYKDFKHKISFDSENAMISWMLMYV